MNRWILSLILVALVILGGINYFQIQEIRQRASYAKPADTSTRLTRVVNTGKLHVAYIIFPPYLSKDTTTGKMSGIFYDVTEKLGANLSLKIDWVEEASLSTLALGFESDRYDMIAFPLWRSAARAKTVAFSVPLFYSTVGIYVREGDKRFDKDISLLNAPDVQVAAIDGELAEAIAKADLPKAQLKSMPQLVDYSQLLLDVASGKADVTFFNRVFGARFVAKNPGKVRDISSERPIRVFAECFVLPINDPALAAMINAALLELIENGGVDDAFRTNGENPLEYYRTALPYRSPVSRRLDGQ